MMNKWLVVLVLMLGFTTLSCRGEPVIQQFPTPTPPMSARDLPSNLDVMLYDEAQQAVMRVVGYGVEPIPGGLEVSILFEPQTHLMDDYLIVIVGWPDDLGMLPADRRELGYLDFGSPRLEVRWIPTSYWVPNEPYIYTREITANPGEYTLRVGVWAPIEETEERIDLYTEDGSVMVELGTYEIRQNP